MCMSNKNSCQIWKNYKKMTANMGKSIILSILLNF